LYSAPIIDRHSLLFRFDLTKNTPSNGWRELCSSPNGCSYLLYAPLRSVLTGCDVDASRIQSEAATRKPFGNNLRFQTAIVGTALTHPSTPPPPHAQAPGLVAHTYQYTLRSSPFLGKGKWGALTTFLFSEDVSDKFPLIHAAPKSTTGHGVPPRPHLFCAVMLLRAVNNAGGVHWLQNAPMCSSTDSCSRSHVHFSA